MVLYEIGDPIIYVTAMHLWYDYKKHDGPIWSMVVLSYQHKIITSKKYMVIINYMLNKNMIKSMVTYFTNECMKTMALEG